MARDDTRTPAETAEVRFPASKGLRDTVIAVLAIATAALAAVVAGLLVHTLGLAALGVFVALGVGPTAWISCRMCFAGPTLTRTEVSSPRALLGRCVVPLSEVRGVGVRYYSAGRGSGWRLQVWTSDREPTSIAVAGPARSEPPGRRRLVRLTTRYVPALDWQYLADAAIGQAAIRIATAVTAVQGPDGPLARSGNSAPARADGSNATAYWTPDGRVGATEAGV